LERRNDLRFTIVSLALFVIANGCVVEKYLATLIKMEHSHLGCGAGGHPACQYMIA
jgi:hypothetical protein